MPDKTDATKTTDEAPARVPVFNDPAIKAIKTTPIKFEQDDEKKYPKGRVIKTTPVKWINTPE